MPKDEKAGYIHFFNTLTKVFREIFQDVPFQEILLPVVISNNGFLQAIWQKYRRKLPKRIVFINIASDREFESLRTGKYSVLLEKNAK